MSIRTLDRVDQEILEILGKHGRISYAELATMVHRSSSAVRKRVDALLRKGVIERFIAKMPYVVEAYHMTGKCGILALVQVADIEELNKSIQEIQSVDGVLDVDACVALEKIK
jgi:DNA-binding Lrp family transcriptional regulator